MPNLSPLLHRKHPLEPPPAAPLATEEESSKVVHLLTRKTDTFHCGSRDAVAAIPGRGWPVVRLVAGPACVRKRLAARGAGRLPMARRPHSCVWGRLLARQAGRKRGQPAQAGWGRHERRLSRFVRQIGQQLTPPRHQHRVVRRPPGPGAVRERGCSRHAGRDATGGGDDPHACFGPDRPPVSVDAGRPFRRGRPGPEPWGTSPGAASGVGFGRPADRTETGGRHGRNAHRGPTLPGCATAWRKPTLV